ncbi:MAG TPA: zinc-dependent alcohol dehydrogenase family protein [Dictyoglomaceae bacterium]|nr:zinc-dependent alcohol dehydrogenase family protein [Dictyoglomaceae bacterium]HOL39065.1 zinc-dependent alcohol dehydrogenase family protein [Dictyoglomaceae bacterium]HOP94404.1 zinc-dependent alcohol dehydrogenase family protein [Dictyoglomaceae bacterium]HPP15759.1 zinc-dependent alcohol dehydrogenase family protein [Dictyoglomaceae bacterium]HPU42748.1 zinc-dependent alcohol dehydrogenase family protein [Dictyoglomaceae bacterium]
MLSAIWEKGKLILKDCAIPKIKSDEVLVKVLASGICGTDLHLIAGKTLAKEGVIRGHEFAGEVVEVGEKVDGLKIGDLVAIDPNIVCGYCYFCRRGEINLCENRTALGVDLNGGFADYCAVPFKQAYKLPQDLTPIEGAMMEPVACALHGIERIGMKIGDSVLIVGGGALGLILLQLSLIYGAEKVIVVEPYEEKRRLALELGAFCVIDPINEDVFKVVKDITDNRGVDVSIEAVGRVETVKTAMDCARRGGKILIFGVSPFNGFLEISPFDIYERELSIMGSFVNPLTNSRALSLIKEKRINVEKIVSHKFPLDAIDKAIEIGLSGKGLRIIITFEG